MYVWTALSVSLVNLVNGFIAGYTSPAEGSLKTALNATDEQFSWVGSLMPLSALAGGLAGGIVIDYFGRRKSVILSDSIAIVSWLFVALATDFRYVLIGRTVGGFSIGISSLAIPVYVAEVSPPGRRGAMAVMPTAFGNIGILLVYVVGAFLEWDLLAWCGACIPIPILIFLLAVPESPKWSLDGRRDENIEKPKQTSKVHWYCSKHHLNPFLLCMSLMFFQQMTGVNAVIFYTTKIFDMSGSHLPPNYCTIIIGCVNFLSSICAVVLVDKLGRKFLLYISSATLLITLTTLSIYFRYALTADNEYIRNIPLLALILYILGFSLGYGPIPWLLMGEILPLDTRNHSAAIITAFNWLMTFLVTKMFATMLRYLDTDGTFGLFAAVVGVSILVVWKWVPETRNRSLEEVQGIRLN